jgi:hypothetical protein
MESCENLQVLLDELDALLGRGILGSISQRVRPIGVVRQRVIGYARMRQHQSGTRG